MKALLEYLLDSSVIVLLHDLWRKHTHSYTNTAWLVHHDGRNVDW